MNTAFAASLRLGTATLALAIASPALAQAPERDERAAAASTPDVAQTADPTAPAGEIVVTARRRAESLQDVPISVTALDGAALESRGAVDLTAVMQQTPNTTLQIARGSNSTLIAFIRGVGQQDPLWGFEPGVGLYVDDVYVARPQGAVLDIFDIERVEILRGPQGTLYGRNTIGGAVKYVTRRLGRDFEGRVRASYGSFNQVDLVGSVSAPLGGGLSAGAAVAWYQRDGYGDNLNTGNEHYNKDVLAGRVSLEYAPNDTLFFRLAGDWTRDDSNARHGYRLTGNAGQPAFAPPASVYDTRAGAGDANRVDTRGLSFTAEFRATPEITLKSITAYRDGETNGNIDFDGTPGPVLDIPAFYEDDQISQEVQLLYEGDRIQGVAGVYYLDGNAAGAFDTVLGLANLTIFTTGSVETRSIAAFTDINFNISDYLRLSVGGRYTRDKRTGTVYRQNFTGIRSPFFGNAAAVPGLVRTNYTNTRTDDEFTPRVSLSWLPNPDTTLYASYSKGYKSGGFDMRGDAFLTPQTVNGYDPETVDAYEVGLKTYGFGRSLYLSLAAFYSDYRNQQVTTQVVAPGPSVASFVDNAGDSRVYGLEAEWRALISDNFSVSGMFGYTNAKFRRFTTFDLATNRFIDVADQRVFQNTPKFTFAVSPTVSANLAGGTIAFTPSMSFRSEYSQFEIPNPLLDEDGYVLVDASIVWTSPDQRLQISAHGRNLLDERYKIGGYNFPGALFGNSIIGFYGPPRTFTLTGQVRF
ncbi:MAG: TonB-dependent receptor [Allosphingosinicella sp.]|uniref:TonB-dependent receptor n=1 Tax=Allosphingosinicella sp. TaxID=2823234 RepID=UPI00394CFDE8